MKIGVVGLGHVGLVSAACLAHVGHEVVGVDSLTERVERLRSGDLPFFEPGLEELVTETTGAGRLHFETDPRAAVAEPEVVLICVGTPAKATGEADLTQVEKLADELAAHLHSYRVLAEKSTVPVRTGQRILKKIGRMVTTDFDVVSNPEFLSEGNAIRDTLQPSRIVIGSDSERATTLMLEVYKPIIERSRCPVISTDVATAELIKHASNAFLANKISFINSIADFCEATGANVDDVAQGMGLDPRIGPDFLRAGIGYGGSCFPKDIAAFAALGEELGCDVRMLRAIEDINRAGVSKLVDKLRAELWNLSNKRIAILGLAFKPGTDDLREAPAVTLVERLVAEGADIVAYDPVAMRKAKETLPAAVRFADSALAAMAGADAAVFVTDWDEFRGIEAGAMKAALKVAVVVDGRNLFSPNEMAAAGITYLSVGRPTVHP
ncbi:MAG: UDP-glucose dehydrogenase family protein [Actinomycetota bacterium]